MADKTEALIRLIDHESALINLFHEAGCPSSFANVAKSAFDRRETYLNRLREIVTLKADDARKESPPSIDDWLTPKQVAEIERVHPKTVHRWLRQGLITAHRSPGGRSWRIPSNYKVLEHAEGDVRR